MNGTSMKALRIISVWSGAACLQGLALVGVGSLELIGLDRLPRTALNLLYSFYSPRFALYRQVTPAQWHTLGNIADGIGGIAFSVVLYSTFLALLWILVRRRDEQ